MILKLFPIPVDGSWGAWRPWTECSTKCGGGRKRRSRKCDSPAPANGGTSCSGDGTKTMTCNTQPCEWGSWSSWSSCSKTCGSGWKTRTRKCDSEDCGDGETSQSEECFSGPCGPGELCQGISYFVGRRKVLCRITPDARDL